MLLFIAITGIRKKVQVFDEFSKGVEDALRLVIKIFPPLFGLFIAVGLLRESGVLDFISIIFNPIAIFTGIPKELVPLIFLRPISGSASLAYIAEIFKTYGTDSLIGTIASVMMGTTETVFYIVTLYFGVTGVKNIRYVLICALAAELVGVLLSCFIVKMTWNG
jgi:spore maturation protein B